MIFGLLFFVVAVNSFPVHKNEYGNTYIVDDDIIVISNKTTNINTIVFTSIITAMFLLFSIIIFMLICRMLSNCLVTSNKNKTYY